MTDKKKILVDCRYRSSGCCSRDWRISIVQRRFKTGICIAFLHRSTEKEGLQGNVFPDQQRCKKEMEGRRFYCAKQKYL